MGPIRLGPAAAKSKSAVACCASLVMSTSTGPGRPDCAIEQCLADGRRDLFGAGDEVVVLGDGQRDAGDVHLLKGIGAQHLARDLAGDADACGIESSIAVAMPVTMLVAPGPDVAIATPTLPDARA